MQALVSPLKQFLGQVKDNANAFVFSALVFSSTALENKFPCSCQPQAAFCAAYITLPCLVVSTMMLLTDMPFQRAWRFTTKYYTCHFICVLLRRITRALCVGLLWAACVLIDGEWFVCCHNPNPKRVADLQCEAGTDITDSGVVMTVKEMRMNSKLYGVSLLLAVTFVAAFLLTAWMICADTCTFKGCDKQIMVHEMILEVGDEVVSTAMKEKQKELLTKRVEDYMDKEQWTRCLDIVEDAILRQGSGELKKKSKTEASKDVGIQMESVTGDNDGATSSEPLIHHSRRPSQLDSPIDADSNAATNTDENEDGGVVLLQVKSITDSV
ncbi:uncharacterized protein LOC125009568 [Mugil cephalus]|uniref:uncharacterized protein LOC125009568 n=1 Tax=Mugil cephalus TaxID=48193 RepID=UPI001FB83CA8|nr:uncharacterized protein LOC125009568 [Mugil cephalus]